MEIFLAGLGILILSGVVSFFCAFKPSAGKILGAGGAMLGSAAGLWTSLQIIITGSRRTLTCPWSMPFGSFSLSIDPLSALFLIPLFILSFFGAMYALEYMSGPIFRGKQGMHWLCYNLLVSSMAVVLASANGLLFLSAWEIMSLSSFCLVLVRHEEKESQDAAWIYLVATHIGTAFLFLFFLLAASQTGSMEFASFVSHRFTPVMAGILFVAGLVGFGSKAGFVPFHVWLPRAHPAAPSHVSALMSGIMIKMGIYGILRSLTFLGQFQPWWGLTLIAVGCVSGILGVLFAIGQHDLKRLLAYHSVENIGIIALGMGLGVCGVCYDIPALAVLGFCGGLLHVVNHALFKGLLFLSAGSVLHATGTAHIERLGGLLKKMPSTAAGFLIGSIAICGLPPLNGFVSEFLIYVAGFNGIKSHDVFPFAFAACALGSLALIGGLAAACFTKAFGTVFLGAPRAKSPVVHATGLFMKIPMYALCILCAFIGLGFWYIAPALWAPVAISSGMPQTIVASALGGFGQSLGGIAVGAALLCVLTIAFVFLRKKLLAGKPVTASLTWDCGYSAPTPRMQYTASSFAQPITSFFRLVLFPKQETTMPASTFPKTWSFQSHVPDVFLDNIYIPCFRWVAAALSRLRWLQGGKVHTYVLYIALILIALLIWNFAWNK